MSEKPSTAHGAAQTPRHELIIGAARFLIQHANCEKFSYDDPQGMRGVFATCMTCCASIHHPDAALAARPSVTDADAAFAAHDVACIANPQRCCFSAGLAARTVAPKDYNEADDVCTD